jgi:hypothetical protein
MASLAAVVLLFLCSCTQWSVTELKPSLYSRLENGTKPGQVFVKIDDGGFESYSLSVGVSNGQVYTVDNVIGRVQILDPDGEIKLLLGSIKDINKKEHKSNSFDFGVIGSILIDNNEKIYVQNRALPDKNANKYAVTERTDYLPSYILVFNIAGNLQYTLGQKGSPDIPFSHIESMNIDSSDRLIVITRNQESWSIFRYRGKQREYFVNLGKLNFRDKDDNNVYIGRIDAVRSFKDGGRFLISVAYYHELRLKYIKVYEYDIAKDAILRTILTIPDPKNVLFDIIKDKYLYFWNVGENIVKFTIADLEGTVINNVSININSRKCYYAKVFSDESGSIFSYSVTRKGIDILKWD